MGEIMDMEEINDFMLYLRFKDIEEGRIKPSESAFSTFFGEELRLSEKFSKSSAMRYYDAFNSGLVFKYGKS